MSSGWPLEPFLLPFFPPSSLLPLAIHQFFLLDTTYHERLLRFIDHLELVRALSHCQSIPLRPCIFWVSQVWAVAP